jgi:hypothetical protein
VFREECKKGDTKEEIYNADKTGLFYSMTPDTTFKFKGEKRVCGKKLKNHLIVLICANVSGMDKKLFIIGHLKSLDVPKM